MQFDDQFFAAIGMADAPAEDKQNMAMQLAELVQNRLAVRLGEVLNDEQAEHFANLLDADKEEEAFAYLEQVCPQYSELAAEEVDRVRQELLSDIDEAVNRLENQQ